jgi:predicted lipoprotein with Yx(FWY)xxD motif
MRGQPQPPSRLLLSSLLILLAASLATGCGSRATTGTPTAQPAASRTVELTLRDGVLMDTQGRPIYVNDQERGGGIRCIHECLDLWQPVVAPRTGAPSTPVPGLGVLHRSDNGMDQLTYLRQPLYQFRMDDAPGEARGDGLRDTFRDTDFTWHLVRVSGPANTTGGTPSGY